MPKLWDKLSRRNRPSEPATTPAPPIEPVVEADATPARQESPSRQELDPAAWQDTQAWQEPPLPNVAHSPDDLIVAPSQGRRGWRARLSDSSFARGLSSLFARNAVLSDELFDELEITLLSADVGVSATNALIDDLRRRTHKHEFADAAALRGALRERLIALLEPVTQPLDVAGCKPFVMLVVGVNGVGKTTTIGKLARTFQSERHNVLLAAGDTFRAAAVAQLQEWGSRLDIPVCAQGQGADSASVIFDALQMAIAHGNDVLIADTAGRLHTRSGLMDELAKVKRVLGKLDANAPHEVLMVIDGTTGRNAISQVRQFIESVGVTGLAVTKLDGTAKGGVVFALASEFALPIRYVGLGERAEDLRAFDAHTFVDGLLPPVG